MNHYLLFGAKASDRPKWDMIGYWKSRKAAMERMKHYIARSKKGGNGWIRYRVCKESISLKVLAEREVKP